MLEKSALQNLLPHQGKMLLLDQVVSFNDTDIKCLTHSHRDADNPLRHAGILPTHTGIEYAAQAAGLHGGLLQRNLQPDAKPQQGYLAVLSRIEWQVSRLDDLVGPLLIYATRLVATDRGTHYRFRLEHAAVCIMQGEFIIALMNNQLP